MSNPSILIVDDEPLARARLRDLIGDIGGYQVVGEAANGVEALQALQSQAITLVLIDIRMPVMDGLELAQHIRQLPASPAIIFTTAYDQFAVQAFELNAIDYLLKPIRVERLALALAKAKPLRAAQWQALPPLHPSQSHLSIHERGRLHVVPIAEILYCRAELKYVTLRTLDKSYLWEGALNQLEIRYPAHFVRIHRNALVARDAMVGFEKQRSAPDSSSDETWQIKLKGIPETLAVSRRQLAFIKTLLPSR